MRSARAVSRVDALVEGEVEPPQPEGEQRIPESLARRR